MVPFHARMTEERSIHLGLFSRPGCHLCDSPREIRARLSGEFPLRVTEVTIEKAPRGLPSTIRR
jgi:hypothetical protein